MKIEKKYRRIVYVSADFIAVAAVVFMFLIGTFASAQSIFTSGLGGPSGGAVFTVTNLINIIRNLACYFIRFAIIASVIAIIVYGIMFLKSRGNPQEFGGAKKALTWGLVGVLVVFSVFTIILSVAGILGVDYPILKIVQCP